jgi:putative tryptophan/tyrosine transport system substrate-binding protein
MVWFRISRNSGVRTSLPLEIWLSPDMMATYCLAIVVMPDLFMIAHRAPIISAAARNNVPTVYMLSAYARDGGLLSYGVDFADLYRRTAAYVDRILRGEKPGNLPVQFPTKFETVVNLKAARALGLTVPQSILLRADEVIE